jgi:hypothetical protein
MKAQVKKFQGGGLFAAFDAFKNFAGSDLGKGIGGIAGSLGNLGRGPGSGISQEAGVGTIHSAKATPQDLLSSDAGAEFRKAIQKRKTGKAIYDGIAEGVNAIPVYGQLISGAMKLGKGIKDLFTKEDEFGITKGQYRRNPELARSKETFGIGKRNAAISDFDIQGANLAFNTPVFNSPQFGKFGMKFRKFR